MSPRLRALDQRLELHAVSLWTQHFGCLISKVVDSDNFSTVYRFRTFGAWCKDGTMYNVHHHWIVLHNSFNVAMITTSTRESCWIRLGHRLSLLYESVSNMSTVTPVSSHFTIELFNFRSLIVTIRIKCLILQGHQGSPNSHGEIPLPFRSS